MPRYSSRCVDVTIPNGNTTSNIVLAREQYEDSDTLTLFGPTTLDAAHVYIIEETYDADATPIVWTTVNNNVGDITPPPANKSIGYPTFAAKAFRIRDSTGSVAADRTWQVIKSWRLDA